MHKQLMVNSYWWQRPQPFWVSLLLVVGVLAVWNVVEARWMAGEARAAVENNTNQTTANPSASLLPYQGFLTKANGQPQNGNQNITFRLFNASTGGTQLWGPELHSNVPVTNGLFGVALGSKTAGGIPPTVWDGGVVYVQVEVNGEILSPREPILNPPMRTMQLLGAKTADPSQEPAETVEAGWTVIKGQSVTDLMEITAATNGGLILVNMTTRYNTAPSINDSGCAIYVYDQSNQFVTRAILDQVGTNSADIRHLACSGGYIFDLPAGTYTFQARGYTNVPATLTWSRQRQIAVFEYR